MVRRGVCAGDRAEKRGDLDVWLPMITSTTIYPIDAEDLRYWSYR